MNLKLLLISECKTASKSSISSRDVEKRLLRILTTLKQTSVSSIEKRQQGSLSTRHTQHTRPHKESLLPYQANCRDTFSWQGEVPSSKDLPKLTLNLQTLRRAYWRNPSERHSQDYEARSLIFCVWFYFFLSILILINNSRFTFRNQQQF